MAFLDHNGESEFPMSKDKVFEAMKKAIPTINGLKIENADKLQGRFVVKAGVSLYSWGENIPIQLSEISENRTKVQITSSPKTGIMFGGAFDMGKNRKNIENILSSTSQILSSESETNTSEIKQTNNLQQTNSQTNNFQTNQNSKSMENNNSNSNAWYEKTWLVVILCIIFFPVGLYALWKNSSISKGWKIGVTILISIIVLANLGGNDKKSSNSKTETTNTTAEPEKEKQWTEVYSFKGNGMKKSPVFELTGEDARIKYSYKAPGGLGMGMFSVYVVDEGEDIMKTGGIPEVMTQAESEESESSIQKSAGKYYLNVNASGSWTVVIEEMR